MKKVFSLLTMALLMLSVVPSVFAVSVGTGIGVDITTEDFAPQVWMCDRTAITDDLVEPDQAEIRNGNYAFEGESVAWEVLVMDKNGIEKLEDVFATIGDVQGEGNYIEVNCDFKEVAKRVDKSCNARILEEQLSGDLSQVAGYYVCTLTVETPESMYGEYYVTVEATDLDGLSGTMDENEYWFFNPAIALSIDGALEFEDVRPGTSSYSDTILVGNDADAGSGVVLDMFISGTNFYDSSSSGAMCPTSNVLDLSNFKYFATKGAYNTRTSAVGFTDSEGYVRILPGDRITQAARIMTGQPYSGPSYSLANSLTEGGEMALTFKLNLPEPCNGDFDTGQIYFWGEAI